MTCSGEGCTTHHILAQRKIGSQKFWILTDINSLGEHQPNEYLMVEEHQAESSAIFDSIKYSAWSEEVTPPSHGWRKRKHFEAKIPAPILEPLVSTMFELQQMAHPMHRGIAGGGVGAAYHKSKDSSSFGIVGR